MNLGTVIAENRKKLGLTQDGLAQKLGVTNQAVSKWESDQSCPDIALLPLLADLFGITLDELFGREAPRTECVALAPAVTELPWADDDTLRIVVYRGHTYLADCPEKEKITFEYKSPALNVDCAVNLVCNDVNGYVRAGGDVSCDTVHGSVEAGGTVSCDDVMGSVSAGGDVSCNSVEGDVSAGGDVTCDDVDGSVSAGGSVSCDCVDGNVSAGGNVTCDEVEGSIYAGGDVICDEIGGTAATGRSFHFTSEDVETDGNSEAITEKVHKFVNDILRKSGIDIRL